MPNSTYIRRYQVHQFHDTPVNHQFELKQLDAYLKNYSSEYILKVIRREFIGKQLANPQGVAERKEEPIYTEFHEYEIEVETGLWNVGDIPKKQQ